MTDRIDPSGANREINRAQETRAREVSRKQSNQAFLQKLVTNSEVGQSAAEQSTSKQVLEQYARGEEASKGEGAKKTSAGPTPKKQVLGQKSQKTEHKKTQKDSKEDRQVEKQKAKVALELAVQRKNQKE